MTNILSILVHFLLLESYDIFNMSKNFYEIHALGIITTGLVTLWNIVFLNNYDIWHVNKMFIGLHVLGIIIALIDFFTFHILIKYIDRMIIIVYIIYCIMYRNIFSTINISHYVLHFIFDINIYNILLTYIINTTGFNFISRNKYLVS